MRSRGGLPPLLLSRAFLGGARLLTIDGAAGHEIFYPVELPLVRDKVDLLVQVQEEVVEPAVDLRDLVLLLVHPPDVSVIPGEDRVPFPAVTVLPDLVQGGG